MASGTLPSVELKTAASGFANGARDDDSLGIGSLVIPRDAYTTAGFLRWTMTDDFPEKGKIELIDGEIFIDMNAEMIDTHALLKLAVHSTLAPLVDRLELGVFFPDGTLITNEAANLSNNPDGSFASNGTLDRKRVEIVPDKSGHYVHSLRGSPDWVLEIVSRSSVQKDTVKLKKLYYKAGVREYWIIDARGKEIDFQILVRGKGGFVSQPKRGNWLNSAVFSRRFSLKRKSYHGLWKYTLDVALAGKG
ncbi:MAG TPA: Uma2 family endonuclease [Pirellulaceae bacterium]|nr:Uma2 family endonuclease [Pirellulaceae bacterium]